MKSFWITVPLKRTHAEQFGLEADKAQSRLDALDRFRGDIETLDPLACGIEISAAATFKLCVPKFEGEILEPFFVRIDPETGEYRDTED